MRSHTVSKSAIVLALVDNAKHQSTVVDLPFNAKDRNTKCKLCGRNRSEFVQNAVTASGYGGYYFCIRYFLYKKCHFEICDGFRIANSDTEGQ